MTRAPAWLLASAALAVPLLLPLLVVAGSLLAPAGEAWTHLASTVLPEYIRTTLVLLVVVGVGVIGVGVATAWCVTAFEFPGRKLLEWALLLPLAVPAYVVAYAYTDWLQYSGPVQSGLRALMGWQRGDYWFPEIRSLGGAAVVFVCVLYPYVYLITRVAFLEQSRSVAEAGRTLGLSARAAFFRITLPMARPAIAAGAALALMETLADFGTVSYFGVQTFTTGIFRAWLSMGEPLAAARLSLVLLGFVAVIVIAERLARSRARFHASGARRPRGNRRPLSGWRAIAVTLACALPLGAGFVIPTALLLHLSLASADPQFGPRFARLALHSASLAALTALIAVGIALLLAYGARVTRSRLAAGVNRLASLGYAMPGAIIAIGVLIPVTRIDNLMADAGIASGLVLTGSLAMLVYAYLVRFLGVALNAVEAGLAQVTPHMEDAARSLGMGAGATLARVHAPILRSSLLTAGLLVFVDVMKELPATFVMRPFDFDTLAVQAYNLAADERLAEASTASLAIVAVGLLPVILAARRLVRSETSAGGAAQEAAPARA
jgi:iron(III) transport system permease protein